MAKLKHENIVSVLDIFEENKTSYLVMEYLDGDTLQSFLDDNTLIDYEKVRSVAIHLLKSLHEIHSKDVLHLDLKPSNIIVKPDNSPVLIDFGAARVVELGNINNLSISVGTEAYAAPEQFEHIVKPFDAYTDLYAFGAILYHIW